MTQTPATKDVLSVLGLSCGGAASAVPIVFADGQDPIKRGLVVRLARPAWKADTSCLVAPQVPGYMVRNKYTSANINLAERHRAASPRSFIMKKRSTLAGWVRIIRFPHFCRCGAGAVRTGLRKQGGDERTCLKSSRASLHSRSSPTMTPSHSHREWSRITRRHQKN